MYQEYSYTSLGNGLLVDAIHVKVSSMHSSTIFNATITSSSRCSRTVLALKQWCLVFCCWIIVKRWWCKSADISRAYIHLHKTSFTTFNTIRGIAVADKESQTDAVPY